MKKIHSLLMIAATAATAMAQTVSVTFQVDTKNEGTVTSMAVAGSYQEAAGGAANWTPGATEAQMTNTSGTLWTLTVNLPENSSFEYKFVKDGSGWEGVPAACATNGNRTVATTNAAVTIPVVCYGSCDPCPAVVYKRNVTFKVTDLNYQNNNFKFTDVKLKGSFNGWTDVTAYDDGTNGDATANDGVWTMIAEVKDGSYEWGGTNNGDWFIKGSNKTFTMDAAGNITGDTTYTIEAVGQLINVTFSVEMSDTVVHSSGVYVTGNFMSFLENKMNNWNKDTLMLTKVGATDVYSGTYKIYADNFQYKFYNGKGNANDERGENTIQAACGEKDGFGNYNRSLGIKGATADSTLPIYKWNSCNTFNASVGHSLASSEYTIAPNPANTYFTVSLSNTSLASLQVLSLDGRVILSQNTGTVNVQNLSTGIYIVNIMDNLGRTATSKIAVK